MFGDGGPESEAERDSLVFYSHTQQQQQLRDLDVAHGGSRIHTHIHTHLDILYPRINHVTPNLVPCTPNEVASFVAGSFAGYTLAFSPETVQLCM